MKIQSFDDLIAWQRAKDLSLQVYHCFEKSRDFNFKDQICRASLSVMNIIAEGFDRQTPKEFRQFLFVARGSCGEVRSMLIFAKEYELISENQFIEMEALANETGRLLSGLIRSINNKAANKA